MYMYAFLQYVRPAQYIVNTNIAMCVYRSHIHCINTNIIEDKSGKMDRGMYTLCPKILL